jgi:hypothetical protein
MRRFAFANALGLAALALIAARADDEQPLVKGENPGQFELVGIGPETLAIKEGEVRVSGKPNGYFATKAEYKNYVLKFEWMYERPDGYKAGDKFDGNSGVLVHIQGGHKVWPKCTEVQLANSDAGNIFAINGAKFQGKTDKDAQKRAIKDVGEWNAEEVTCLDGLIRCTINGVEVARGNGADPDHGPIGFQSEGRPIRFRKMTIRVLD